MKLSDAVGLIRPAVANAGGTWVDFGAGTGLFSRALARLLGPDGKVIALDSDARAIASLRESAGVRADGSAEIVPVLGDFEDVDVVRRLATGGLDGGLFANALHFVRDAGRVLEHVVALLEDGGRIVVVEYDGRGPSRWVPYPLPRNRLRALAAQASLEPPRVVGERASAYGGVIYCATMGRGSG